MRSRHLYSASPHDPWDATAVRLSFYPEIDSEDLGSGPKLEHRAIVIWSPTEITVSCRWRGADHAAYDRCYLTSNKPWPKALWKENLKRFGWCVFPDLPTAIHWLEEE